MVVEAEGTRDSAPAWRYRPPSSLWLAGGAAALAAVVLGAQLGVDEPDVVLRALPWYGLVATAIWAALWHPHVVVDADGVTLVNPLRTIVVPWAAIVTVETRFAFALRTPSGRYTAWAGPGPGRHQALSATNRELRAVPGSARDARGSVSIGDLPVAPAGIIAAQVRRRWQALVETGALVGAADDAAVTLTWHRRALALCGAFAVLGLVAQVL